MFSAISITLLATIGVIILPLLEFKSKQKNVFAQAGDHQYISDQTGAEFQHQCEILRNNITAFRDTQSDSVLIRSCNTLLGYTIDDNIDLMYVRDVFNAGHFVDDWTLQNIEDRYASSKIQFLSLSNEQYQKDCVRAARLGRADGLTFVVVIYYVLHMLGMLLSMATERYPHPLPLVVFAEPFLALIGILFAYYKQNAEVDRVRARYFVHKKGTTVGRDFLIGASIGLAGSLLFRSRRKR